MVRGRRRGTRRVMTGPWGTCGSCSDASPVRVEWCGIRHRPPRWPRRRTTKSRRHCAASAAFVESAFRKCVSKQTMCTLERGFALSQGLAIARNSAPPRPAAGWHDSATSGRGRARAIALLPHLLGVASPNANGASIVTGKQSSSHGKTRNTPQDPFIERSRG